MIEMKEFWNKLITEYRKNQQMEKDNYCKGSRWLYYIAQDNQRKIKKSFL